MKRVSRWMIPALLVLGSLMGCKDAEPVKLPVRPVPAMKVGDVSRLIESTFPGRAKATEEVNLAFRVPGPLIARPVKVGDSVKQGDIVARIDPRDFETRVASLSSKLRQAQAQLKSMRVARPEDIGRLQAALAASKAERLKAESDFKRTEQLYLNDNASKADLDRARALRDVATQQVRSATEQLRIGRRGAREEDIEAMIASIQRDRSGTESGAGCPR